MLRQFLKQNVMKKNLSVHLSRNVKKSKFLFACILGLILIVAGCHDSGRFRGSHHIAPPPTAQLQDSESLVHNTEEYDLLVDNPFKTTWDDPLSTFSIDVDNASYSMMRGLIEDNRVPPKDAIRIEELINYFDYQYPEPGDEHPLAISTDLVTSPWSEENQILRIGLQAKRLDLENLKPSNLTFLIDVSGSMQSPDKLPLVKKSIKLLLNNLSVNDKVSIVVYAGSSGLVLPATAVSDENLTGIIRKIDALEPGGSTAGYAGIELAYQTAMKEYMEGGNNRVVLCTDGDFNVGVSSSSELVRLIEEKRQSGVYLTICGFGMGNYKDGRMEQISNAGNGNYFYVDNVKEAERVFSKRMRANMFTVAKDVKIQVEFNPQHVQAYRLIGYENRVMAKEDFNDDKKDAGELGAGHTVTALYEVVPVGVEFEVSSVDDLRYQSSKSSKAGRTKELATVKLRYKPIGSEASTSLVERVDLNAKSASDDMTFAMSVASFGMILRDSPYKGSSSLEQVLEMAEDNTNDNEDREEFVRLIEKYRLLRD